MDDVFLIYILYILLIDSIKSLTHSSTRYNSVRSFVRSFIHSYIQFHWIECSGREKRKNIRVRTTCIFVHFARVFQSSLFLFLVYCTLLGSFVCRFFLFYSIVYFLYILFSIIKWLIYICVCVWVVITIEINKFPRANCDI